MLITVTQSQSVLVGLGELRCFCGVGRRYAAQELERQPRPRSPWPLDFLLLCKALKQLEVDSVLLPEEGSEARMVWRRDDLPILTLRLAISNRSWCRCLRSSKAIVQGCNDNPLLRCLFQLVLGRRRVHGRCSKIWPWLLPSLLVLAGERSSHPIWSGRAAPAWHPRPLHPPVHHPPAAHARART